jgi:DNA-binding XRE family transcriptional regulator
MERYHSLEEITDKYIGEKGSVERDSFDADVEAALIGAAIKDARKAKNLTQRELGERVGVQTAQISKIESGRNLTIATIVKVLKGLGLTADFSISGISPITLGAN